MKASDECKLCGKVGPLARSHIIPRSFYGIKQSRVAPKLLSSSPRSQPKKSWTGVYDQFVCLECEHTKFQDPDSYAFRLFLGDDWKPTPVPTQGPVTYFLLEHVDCRLLRLFALTLLWRAHACSDTMFARVDVGPYEPQLTSMVAKSDPGTPDCFPVIFSRYTDVKDVGILDPHIDRYSGVRFYRFLLGLMQMYIKVDSRPVPRIFEHGVLRGSSINVVARQFKGSGDHRSTRAVIGSNRNAF